MRILIVDDDQELSRMVRQALATQGFAVDIDYDVADALQKIKEVPYDLVLFECALFESHPGMFLQQLRLLNYRGAVFIVSRRGDEEAKLGGFQQGVDDYIVKPFYISELIARIRLVEHRRYHGPVSAETPSLLTAGDLRVDLITGVATRKAKTLVLRPKEYAILLYLMKRAGQIVSHQEINQHVWNLDFDPQSARLEAHISRLRAKLSDGFKTSLIETVPGRGYRLAA